jgi:hypothetical protein
MKTSAATRGATDCERTLHAAEWEERYLVVQGVVER